MRPVAAILVVGDEILAGRTQDTNSHHLAGRLAARGVRLAEVRVVGDDPERIATAVRELSAALAIQTAATAGAPKGARPAPSAGAKTAEASPRATGLPAPGVLLVVGGLGPTPDDRTLDGIARATGRALRLDAEAERMVRRAHGVLVRLGLATGPATDATLKMARLPEGATALPNGAGSAPGVRLPLAGGVTLYALPGVPREMMALFDEVVAADLPPATAFAVEEVEWRGVEERAVAALVALERSHPRVVVGSYPTWGRPHVVFRLSGEDAAEVRAASEALRRLLAALPGPTGGA